MIRTIKCIVLLNMVSDVIWSNQNYEQNAMQNLVKTELRNVIDENIIANIGVAIDMETMWIDID